MLSLKEDIFSKILNKNIREIHGGNNAQYMSILSNDIGTIEQDYFINVLGLIRNIFMFVLASILIIRISIYISLGVLVASIFIVIIPQFFNSRVSISKKNLSDSLSDFTAHIKDIFSGFEIIKSFNIEKRVSEQFRVSNNKVEKNKFHYTLISGIVDSLSYLFGFIMLFIAMGIGTYLTMKGAITIGAMIASVQLMNNVMGPVESIATGFSRMKSIKLIEEKIEHILKNKDLVDDIGVKKDNFKNLIEFKNVSFSYTSEKTTLNNIDVKFKKNNKYAIVGTSGSGKSTILKILLRYYEDFSGQVLIDNLDLCKINSNDLYKLVSIIHQNIFMFDDSIKNNITLYGEYTTEQLNRAINLAGLSDYINNLSDKEHTKVGENGCCLSGGEKQRIAIARSIIKSTPILVLDEVTSSLDNETAYHIEKSILNIEDLTAIIVTHKLSIELLSKYDNILAVKDGKIVESGTFYELMNKKGYFYSLYSIQDSDNFNNYNISESSESNQEYLDLDLA